MVALTGSGYSKLLYLALRASRISLWWASRLSCMVGKIRHTLSDGLSSLSRTSSIVCKMSFTVRSAMSSVATGTITSRAAVNALVVSTPNEGGQSIRQ